MDKIAGLKAFVAVVEAGGFSSAARVRQVAPSTLTRLVDALEEELGTRLLYRSTRTVAPTEAGLTYFGQAVKLLDDLAVADATVAGRDAEPAGVLRLGAPVAFARLHLAPLIPSFLARCPAIELDLSVDDTIVDLSTSDLDCALRLGRVYDDRVIARRLAEHRRILCAAPAYLAEHGSPAAPSELVSRPCLTFSYRPSGTRRSWQFMSGDGETATVEVSGPLRCGNSEILREAALAGAGIALLPEWLVGIDVRTGGLTQLLPDWRAEPALFSDQSAQEHGVYAVYLPSRRGLPRLQAFLSFIAEQWSPIPPWASAFRSPRNYGLLALEPVESGGEGQNADEA